MLLYKGYEEEMMTKSLKDQVYEYISRKIQLGEIFPNEKITEVGIANEMGISRTPVREALIQMISDGLLEKTPDKGLIIKKYSKEAKFETFQIIGALDGLAGSLATSYLTDEDLLKMQELTEKMDIAIKYHNYQDYGNLKHEFHSIYINKSGNETLNTLLNSMINNTMPKTYYSNDQEKLFNLLSEYSNREHKELIECFYKKDTAAVEAKLREHWKIVDEESI
jgi:DNA-binding GntR family transcriptional regulator